MGLEVRNGRTKGTFFPHFTLFSVMRVYVTLTFHVCVLLGFVDGKPLSSKFIAILRYSNSSNC
jgi:hypothetical protein